MFLWLVAFLCVTFLSLPQVSATAPNSTSSDIPLPLVIPPSQLWEGNDGPWSTFFLRVGSPVQEVQVLISTASNQPLVVLPQGCPLNSASTCISSRGGVFNPSNSSTWVQNNVTEAGIFQLAIERNLNFSINALYGTDTVGLSLFGTGAPSLDSQLLGGIANSAFDLGVFGLNPASTNFSNFDHPVESYMSNLRAQNMIPSISYGYTAGNSYRFNTKVVGSLSLGGYDNSIIEPNDLIIAFSDGNTRDLTVNMQSISFSTGTTRKNLSTSSFPAFVDSTVPYLYLPVEVCEQFEEAFGLSYDNATGLYLVNDALHNKLIAQAANVTFTITNSTSQVLVDIVLPYQAFDLVAAPPLVQNTTRYFPLKRAFNNNQTTLGRTFLQEAYLIADYERSEFQLFQRNWDPNAKQTIQIILPPAHPTALNNSSQAPKANSTSGKVLKLSVAAIVGISIGGTVFLALLFGGTIYIRGRKQKHIAIQNQSPLLPQIPSPNPSYSENKRTTYSGYRTELDAVSTMQESPELDAGPIPIVLRPPPVELYSRARISLHELPADEIGSQDPQNQPEDVMNRPRPEMAMRQDRRKIRVYQETAYSRHVRDHT